MRHLTRTLALLCVSFAACTEDTRTDLGEVLDSGIAVDSGIRDLGPSDQGLPSDAGFAPDGALGNDGGQGDAGGVEDATTPADATTPGDAATSEDANAPEDATVAADAGGPDADTDGGPLDLGSGPDVGPNDGGSGPCNVEGVYAVNIQGMTVYFSFDPAAGTWVGALTIAELTTNPLGGGTFGYANGQFTIEDAPNGAGCDPGQVGVYAVNFTPTCDAFTLTLISEGCTGRGQSLDGTTFTR